MTDFTNHEVSPSLKSSLYQLAQLAMFVFAGLCLGNLFGFILVLPFVGLDINSITSAISDPVGNDKARNLLLLLQAVISIFAFIIAPLLYLHMMEKRSFAALNSTRHLWIVGLLLSGILIISFMPFNALFIKWNNEINLPDVFEAWAKEKETSAQRLTEAITRFDNIGQFLIGLIVIAFIPAFGEELLFRGLIQPKVFNMTGNIHAAVWITGLIFSAIHIQFYGLVPRMFLGVLLGYLYAWSGNLWYPIIGHLANNGFTLLMIYLSKEKIGDFDISENTTFPIGGVIASFIVTSLILYYLKNYFDKHREAVYD